MLYYNTQMISMSTTMPTTDTRAFHQHDHDHCIDEALSTAHQLCKDSGVKLTSLREQVFTIVWQSHKPLGAYAILEQLAEAQAPGQRRMAPPTVYRALEFLQANGLVHRIASLNAYIGCCTPARAHQSHFLICRQCDATVEIPAGSISQAIAQSAQLARFQVEAECVEIIGLCPRCQTQQQGASTDE